MVVGLLGDSILLYALYVTIIIIIADRHMYVEGDEECIVESIGEQCKPCIKCSVSPL